MSRTAAYSIFVSLISGVVLFFSTVYVVFLYAGTFHCDPVAATACTRSHPYVYLLISASLVTALSTMVAALATRLPVVLAPATGVIFFLSGYIEDNKADVDLTAALLGCLIAGLVVSVMSIPFRRPNEPSTYTNLRFLFLDNVPNDIKDIVGGGIGGILGAHAVQVVLEIHGGGDHAVAVNTLQFMLGLSVILLGDVWLRSKALVHESQSASGWQAPTYQALASLAVLMSFLLMASINYIRGISRPIPYVEHSLSGAITYAAENAISLFAAADRAPYTLHLAPIAFYVVFILLVDFVGSPYDFWLQKRRAAGSKCRTPYSILDVSDLTVKKGMRLDSAMNIVAPVVGCSPMVFFAENHLGVLAGGRSGYAGVVAAAGFLAICALAVSGGTQLLNVFAYITDTALAPIVFWLALRIISNSFPLPGVVTDVVGAEGGNKETLLHADFVWVPSAAAVVGAGVGGFQIGLLAGLFFYVLCRKLDVRTPPFQEKDIAALVLLVVSAVVYAFGGMPS